MNTQPTTISQLQMKIAAGVITGIILGLGATGFAFIDGKANKSSLEAHCHDNERVENAIYWQIQEQRGTIEKNWKRQEAFNSKIDEQYDKIIDILYEISGDNKAMKTEIMYLSGKKKANLIDDTIYDEKYSYADR